MCMEPLGAGVWVKQLPKCGHVFHPCCIERWLTTHAVVVCVRALVCACLGDGACACLCECTCSRACGGPNIGIRVNEIARSHVR